MDCQYIFVFQIFIATDAHLPVVFAFEPGTVHSKLIRAAQFLCIFHHNFLSTLPDSYHCQHRGNANNNSMMSNEWSLLLRIAAMLIEPPSSICISRPQFLLFGKAIIKVRVVHNCCLW